MGIGGQRDWVREKTLQGDGARRRMDTEVASMVVTAVGQAEGTSCIGPYSLSEASKSTAISQKNTLTGWRGAEEGERCSSGDSDILHSERVYNMARAA